MYDTYLNWWIRKQSQYYTQKMLIHSLFSADDGIYFSDTDIPVTMRHTINNIEYLFPRDELKNEAYAVQSTAYALLAHLYLNGGKTEADSMMNWLNSMRNHIGGFASTQVCFIHRKLDGDRID